MRCVLQVNQKLQLIAQGKWVDEEPEERRSPSPEPLYNELGARTNTREQRAKDKLARQRNVSSRPLLSAPAQHALLASGAQRMPRLAAAWLVLRTRCTAVVSSSSTSHPGQACGQHS